jgi:hypothetical protein
LEPLRGDWEIVQKSLDFTRESASLAKFRVLVPAEGSASLTYRVRVRW